MRVPTTEADFYAVLDKIKEEGSYIPWQWAPKTPGKAATMGYTNIGPSYWNGEEGRQGLIKGDAKFY